MKGKVFLIIFILLLFLTTTVYAQSDTGTINISNIGIHSNNQYSSPIVDTLSINNKLTILDETTDWFKVSSPNGNTGWIEQYFVNVNPDRYVLNTCGSRVNLRTAPTTSSKIVGQISNGEKIKYIDTFHSWYLVEYNGQQVYMASWLGEIVSDGSSKVYLIDDKINIRNKPGIYGSVIYQGNKNESFGYYGEIDGWIKIKLPSGEYGYVAGWLVSFNNNFSINKIEAYKITTDNLRLREGPSLNDTIISVLKYGTKVRVLETNDRWDKIITNDGQVGYSYNEYLKDCDPLEGKSILLNAGHGGRDPGSIGFTNKFEKTVNLIVTTKLKDCLENLGAKVFMTRTTDTYINRKVRADMADNLSVDLMFSIHHNALTKNDYYGMSTYYDTKNNASGYLGKTLAECVYQNVVQINSIYEDGVYDRNFEVLRETDVPAALIEIGFMTNKWEEQNIHLSSFQDETIEKIALGIIEYFDTIE